MELIHNTILRRQEKLLAKENCHHNTVEIIKQLKVFQ